MRSATLGLITCAAGQDVFLAQSPNLFSEDCSTRSTPSSDPLEQICYLLKKNRDTYDISWAPPYVPVATFQDHIPYDLVAQYLLGATADQLSATYAFHEQDEGLVAAIPSTGAITKANWQEKIGENGDNPSINYSDYVDYYRGEVASLGAKQAMLQYLPSLVDGVFGKLFHGMQTLGWGYGMTGDEDMVAQGLAWMSTAFAPPAPLNASPTKTDLNAVLNEMHADTRLPIYTGDPTIFYAVYRDELIANYSSVMAEYDLHVPDEISMDDATEMAQHMSDEVMKLFAAYNYSHFTNVHYSGSVKAMQNMLEWADAPTRSQLLRRMWQAITYNFGIQSRPSPELPSMDIPPASWENILARTFNQTDVHIHELTYYTMQDHHNLDDEFLRSCADNAIKLFENGGDWDF